MYQAVLNVPELRLILRLKQLGTENYNVRCCFNGESKKLIEAAPGKVFTSNSLRLIEKNDQSEHPEKLGPSKKLEKIDLRYTLGTLTQGEIMNLVGNNPKVIAGLECAQSKNEHNILFIGDMPFGVQLNRAGKMLFLCLKCGKMLMKSQSMLAHAYNHIGVRQFPCNLCDKEYAYRSGLERHKKKQHGPSLVPGPISSTQRFQCSICQNHYANKYSLARHWRKSHKNSESPLPIKATVGPTSSMPAPATHVTSTIKAVQIPADDKRTCEVCSKTLSNKKSLKLHFNTFHSSINNFLCQYCFKGFYYKKDYDYHMKRECASQRRQKIEKENIPPIEELLSYIMEN